MLFRSKFEVNIFGPNNSSVPRDMRKLTLLCEEASIPGLNIATRTVRLHNLTVQRPATVDYVGDAQFTFLVDGAWQVRKYFDAWMQQVITINREVGEYDKITGRVEINAIHEGTLSPEASSVPLNQTFEQHNRYSVRLEQAFPKSIGPMPVSYGNPGLLRMQVTFAFKRWETNYQTTTNISSLPPVVITG